MIDMRTRRFPLIVLLFFCCIYSFGQVVSGQEKRSAFRKLSGPEKWWVIGHPFKAARAYRSGQETLKLVDSLSDIGLLDKDNNGGTYDAFKHCYWMADLSTEIGAKAALKLGNARERGNAKNFRKNKDSLRTLPDHKASLMDLHNNQVGLSIGKHTKDLEAIARQAAVLDSLQSGRLRILKKKSSKFLNCQGRVLSKQEWIGQWDNEKCLVPSGPNKA